MKNCKRCNQEMADEINFCPTCGENQREKNLNESKGSTAFLTALCVLTIIGSIFTMGRAYLYEMISSIGNPNYIRGWIYGISSIGTLIGAVLMIQQKLKGLYIYSISQGIYILTVFAASFSYGDTFNFASKSRQAESFANSLASGIAMLFLIPSIVFLILYWTNMIKKHLT